MKASRFIALQDARSVGQQAALLIARQIKDKPDASIVFPTGKTPLPLYAVLRQMSGLGWSKTRLFQLDEYVKPTGLQEPLPYETFATFLNRELWHHIGGNKYYIQDYLACPDAYEKQLSENGGPDLVILGIGGNGHIAFNEPGSSPDSITRVVSLAPKTLNANFGDSNKAGYPTEAITMGLATILASKQIILLATGVNKQDIVAQAFAPDTEPSVHCPASWLKRHPCLTVMTDFEFPLSK